MTTCPCPGWGFRSAIDIAAPIVDRHPACDTIIAALRKHGPLRLRQIETIAEVPNSVARYVLPQLCDAGEVARSWEQGVGKGRAHWVYRVTDSAHHNTRGG